MFMLLCISDDEVRWPTYRAQSTCGVQPSVPKTGAVKASDIVPRANDRDRSRGEGSLERLSLPKYSKCRTSLECSFLYPVHLILLSDVEVQKVNCS